MGRGKKWPSASKWPGLHRTDVEQICKSKFDSKMNQARKGGFEAVELH